MKDEDLEKRFDDLGCMVNLFGTIIIGALTWIIVILLEISK